LRHDPRFKAIAYYPPHEYQHPYRCALDYPEDLLLLRILFAAIKHPGPIDAIHYLRRHEHLTAINARPAVTVYIPCHNYGRFVVDAMESVTRQTFTDWELRVYDDGSTDDTSATMLAWYGQQSDEMQGKIHLNRVENQGLPAICNMAIDASRGQWVIRLDADDTMGPDCLHDMVAEARAVNPQPGAVISGFSRIGETGEPMGDVLTNEWHPACALIDRQAACLVRYRDGLKYFDGVDFWSRFLQRVRPRHIKRALWNYRQHGASKTAEHIDKRAEAMREVLT